MQAYRIPLPRRYGLHIDRKATILVSMERRYRHQGTSVPLIDYHSVFCPKRRRKALIGPVRERRIALIHETATEIDREVLALEVTPDRVHLFVSAPPDLAPNQLVGRFKGKGSRPLRLEYPVLRRLPSLWTRSYWGSTAGNVARATIECYIAAQATRG
jgi:putative transposase